MDMTKYTWPAADAGLALQSLARVSGLEMCNKQAPTPPKSFATADTNMRDQWMTDAAAWLDLELERVHTTLAELEELLLHGGPALFEVGEQGDFLAVSRGRDRDVYIWCPDNQMRGLPAAKLSRAVRNGGTSVPNEELDHVFALAGVPLERQARAADLLSASTDEVYAGCRLLKLAPSAPLRRHFLRAGLLGRSLDLMLFYTLTHLCFVGSWWVLVEAALEGSIGRADKFLWLVLLVGLVGFQTLTNWFRGLVAVDISTIFKERLFRGLECLEEKMIRGKGSGRLLGLAMESRTLETLSINAGFDSLFVLIEWMTAMVILTRSQSVILPVLLLLWLIPILVFTRIFYRNTLMQAELRADLIGEWVERMDGYQTRLLQEVREHWFHTEDWLNERYYQHADKMDKSGFLLVGVVPRGWLIIGVAGSLPLFLSAAATARETAFALGGVILAYRALEKLRKSLGLMIAALVSWRQVRPLLSAATRKRSSATPLLGLPPQAVDQDLGDQNVMLTARDLYFKYDGRPKAILKQCFLRVENRDRILLQGASGGGKSTLVAIMLGLRRPQSGLVLLHGLDQATLGETGWRRRVSGAPQFHTNHIFTGTLAFNLLMGRGWPPSKDDLADAQSVCRDLGLGHLLDDLPHGLMEEVGVGGRNLSHGERGRICIARALLQTSDLLIFDESFATLDPVNLQQAMNTVLERAGTVIVVAHP